MISDKDLPSVLANSSNQEPGLVHNIMQVSNMFSVKFIFCPSKANLSRLKS